MAAKSFPLNDVTQTQIYKILRKLQLVAPTTYDVDGRIELLQSSVVFNNGLQHYDDDDILVQFSKGNFVDFQTSDGSFDGLFAKSNSGKILYPCQVCAGEVTSKNDSTGFGIECDGCGMFFHNSCTNKPLTAQQFASITDSPSYVKVLCPPCNRVYGSADLKLKRIEHKVELLQPMASSPCLLNWKRLPVNHPTVLWPLLLRQAIIHHCHQILSRVFIP